jgi:chemotaxis protein methyltransferase CheR
MNGKAYDREFQFFEQDFQRVRKLIYEYAGINLNDNKQELVYSRLVRRLRATNAQSFSGYLEQLERGKGSEREEFINALTTNHTAFFRESHHFSILAEYLKQLDPLNPITIWCAASSTGEEAYSIAITVVEALGGYKNSVRIIASDLDTRALKAAREGRYKTAAVTKLTSQQVSRFFQQDSRGDPEYMQVKAELRQMINFQNINLLATGWPVQAPLDVIFCRNVMIYFDKQTQLSILRKFAPLLCKQGLLFAGHSERFFHAADLFTLIKQTVYELTDKSQVSK